MNKIIRMIFGFKHEYPETKTKQTITILIPAFNEEKSIRDTIESCKNQVRVPDEILVVDDCSQDKTSEVAKRAGARVIRLEKNSGTKSQAQNAGLPYIKSDITITIDADTTLDRRAVEEIIKPLSDPRVASVCGMVVPRRIKSFWEKGRFIEYLYGIRLNKGAQQNLGMALVSSGCMSAFRSKELQEKGFKDRTLAEDMDLSWEFLIEKRNIACVTEAICYPIDPSNWKIYKNQVDRWYRSFFQNISVYKWNIFKSKRLFAFISWYLLEGLIALGSLALLPYFIISGNYILVPLIGLNFALIPIVVIWAAHKMGKKWLALKSIPCFFVISFINMYLFWRSFFKEWIVRDRLTVWNKGH